MEFVILRSLPREKQHYSVNTKFDRVKPLYLDPRTKETSVLRMLYLVPNYLCSKETSVLRTDPKLPRNKEIYNVMYLCNKETSVLRTASVIMKPVMLCTYVPL